MKIIHVLKTTIAAALLLISAGSSAQRRAPISTGENRPMNQPRIDRPDRGRDNNNGTRPPGGTFHPQPVPSQPFHPNPSPEPMHSPAPTGSSAPVRQQPSFNNYHQPQAQADRGPGHSAYSYNNNYNNNRYRSQEHNRFYYSGAYHPRPSYYRPYRAPSFGVRINILPSGYYPFHYRHNDYYYYGGNFYRHYGGYYETIAPPLGAVIMVLPSGAFFSTINNIGYYEYDGTYYEPYSGGGYRVAGINGYLKSDLPVESADGDIISDDSIGMVSSSPAIITELPADFKTVILNNTTYYVSPSGEYYTKNIDENGHVNYRLSAASAPQN